MAKRSTRPAKPAKKAARPAPAPTRGNGQAQPVRRETSSRNNVEAPSPPRGRYVYCIIRSSKALKLGQSTIAGEVGDVP